MPTSPRVRIRRLVALAGALALLVAACGGGGGVRAAPEVDTDVEPVFGGVLHYGVEGEPSGLNPTNDALAASGQLMGRAVFDPLAAYDADGVPRPYLAEAFVPRDGFRTWDIRVRDGVRFHDGTLLDAEALWVNLQAQRDDAFIGLALRPLLDPDLPFEVVGERTVRVHLAQPNAHYPAFLAGQYGYVASPTWLAAAKVNGALDLKPVGTGPFRYAGGRDGVWEFERNDGWWNGDVYLDGVEFTVQPDPGSRTRSLLAGDFDIIHTDHPTEIEHLRREPDVVNHEDELGEELFVMLNTQEPPFDDIRARRALTLATPRTDYVETLGAGIVTPADSMFHPDTRWYTPGVVQESDDPEAAAELVADYCADVPDHCDGDRIEMSYSFPAGADLDTLTADLLIDGWSDLFEVKREPTTQERLIQEVAFGRYQSVLWRQFGDPDPEVDRIFLDCSSIGTVSLNWPRNCDPATQRALDAQRATDDFEKRRELWAEVVARMHDDYAYIFLSHSLWDVAHRLDVHGVGEWTLPDGSPALPIVNGVHDLSRVFMTGSG